MAGFENKNTFDDGLPDDGLKTIPVGAAMGGLPVSAEVVGMVTKFWGVGVLGNRTGVPSGW
jgi:hypothetical protein